jgi:hypothetical protein
LVDELETIRDTGTGIKSLVYSQFTRYLDMVGHILRWKGNHRRSSLAFHLVPLVIG